MKNNTMNPTRISLNPKARATLAALLNQHLANLTDLVSQLNTAHWNVRGPHFHSLHKAFEEVAEMVEEPIDELAERITTLGGKAAGTVRAAASASSLPEFPATAQGLELVAGLAGTVAVCANAVRADIERAEDAGDAGTADLLTGLSQTLDKVLWLLEAHEA